MKVLVLLLSLLAVSLTACSNSDTNYKGYEEIKDANLISDLANYDLKYELVVPGNSMTYNYLWDGYASADVNKSLEVRYYTYLTEYKACDEKYYLLYLKTNALPKYEDEGLNYEDMRSHDPYNYHFSSYASEEIIDGKYLNAFKLASDKDYSELKMYVVDDISNIKFKVDDYQLIFAAKKKDATIKENVSLAKAINKDITLYVKYDLIFNDFNVSPSYYTFKTSEADNQKKLNEAFAVTGEVLEAFPIEYEDKTCVYVPNFGLNIYKNFHRLEVLEEDGSKYLLLPRYEVNDNKDLLSLDYEAFLNEDIYGNYKELFKDSFVKATSEVSNGYIMGLYDYDKVSSIISNNH